MRHAGSGLPLRRCGGTRLYVLGSRQGQAPWPNGTVVKDCTLNIGKSVAAGHAVDPLLRSGSDNDVTNMADFNLPLQLTIKLRMIREHPIGISEVARVD